MTRIAIGPKNWLLMGSLRAGIRNASWRSWVAIALRMKLDVSMSPIEYQGLRSVRSRSVIDDRRNFRKQSESTGNNSSSLAVPGIRCVMAVYR